MKTLIFAGSTSQNSVNRKLAHAAAGMVRATGVQVTHLELADLDLPLYNADLEARALPADVLRLKALLFEHSAWIICSPEYNASYTPLLKNTLDWASRPVADNALWSDGYKPFAGKVVGLLGASPGALGGLQGLLALAPLLLKLQCWVAPKRFALGHAGSAFDEQGALTNPAQREGVQAVLDQTLWAAQRLA